MGVFYVFLSFRNVGWSGERTIIVKGGNVFIDNNLFNGTSNFVPLGIIVLRDLAGASPQAQGHVYVNVKASDASAIINIQATVFADGAVFPYAKDANGNDFPIDSQSGEPQFLDGNGNPDPAGFKTTFDCCQLYWQGSIASEKKLL